MTYHTKLQDSEEPNKKNRYKGAGNEKEDSVKAYFKSQTKKCKLPLSASKKENLETTMEPKLKTSKDALRRQKMMREIFNDVIMCKDITSDVWIQKERR